MANAAEVASEARNLGLVLFDTTVTPEDNATARQIFDNAENIRVGIGLHPWWVAGGETDNGSRKNANAADRAALLAASAQYVGEVGLDFSPRHQVSAPQQIQAFELIMAACAERPIAGRIISIHAVQAARTVLDILERFDLTHQASCMFHWFSGTSDELVRARTCGCLFSVNARMLNSKRGREYARQIPEQQLLIETDAPPQLDSPYHAQAIVEELDATLDSLAELRDTDRGHLSRVIAERSIALLGL